MKKKHVEVERPKTCVIYIRVSSEEQVRGYSLSSQDKACREYAEKQGWTVLRVYREEGESAKTADRTQLRAMQMFCLKRPWQVGYVLVWKVDRFSRNQLDYLKLKQLFESAGTELKSATEVIENTPQGHFSESVLTAVAQYENELRMERTRIGIQSRAQDGYWIAGAPWGYKNVLDAAGKKVIEPHQERAPIVQYIFKEFSRGTVSYKELAKKVNALGDIRSTRNRKVDKQLIYKILRNPIYSGRIVVPKLRVNVQGRHDALVSEGLFNEVQEVMNGGKKSNRPKHLNNPDFPLRGVKCGLCRGSISGGYSTGRSKKYAYYGCINRRFQTQ